MSDKGNAIAYSKGDFSDSNGYFVSNLLSNFPHIREIIDLGCGPADIPIMLAKARPKLKITAIDASAEMIKIARKKIKSNSLQNSIRLAKMRIPNSRIKKDKYDAVISKDLLHHLPDSMAVWNEAKRISKKGAVIYVMDLCRPKSKKQAREMVEKILKNGHPLLKRDFYNSLCAAFTLGEVRGQLRKAGLKLRVSRAGNRHFIVKGRM